MIDRDQAAEIRRYFFAEHWKKGTIASQLGVHPDVVERAIGPLGPEPKARPDRPRLLDPYVDFIDEVLERYPKLESINDYKEPWKQERWEVGGETLSLDAIEHERLRPVYKDPRIHFAVNCASIGCPALRPEAYTADNLEAQLEDSTRKFLSDKQRNRFNADKNALEVSKIFDWYEEDFENAAGSLAEYLLPYADKLGVPEEKRQLMKNDDLTIRHLDYNWKLNKQ